MKLEPARLRQHLGGKLQPAYWVSGDEPLLLLEAADTIRQAALQQGFSNRHICHADTHTNWQDVLSEACGMSLFGDRNLLEIRFATGRPKAEVISTLGSYLSQPNPDTVVLITSPKLEKSLQATKGYKTLESLLATVAVWPITASELPRWLQGRLQQQQLTIEPEALALLAANVEGNLLAAQQQIQQLALLAEGNTITADWLAATIANNARFDVFGTADKALAGNAAAAITALQGLAAEGLQPANIVWVLAREIQTLIHIREQARSLGPDKALQQARVWQRREPLIRAALRRLKMPQLQACLLQAQTLDKIAKGQAAGNAWDEAATLVLMLSGPRQP